MESNIVTCVCSLSTKSGEREMDIHITRESKHVVTMESRNNARIKLISANLTARTTQETNDSFRRRGVRNIAQLTTTISNRRHRQDGQTSKISFFRERASERANERRRSMAPFDRWTLPRNPGKQSKLGMELLVSTPLTITDDDRDFSVDSVVDSISLDKTRQQFHQQWETGGGRS